MNLQDGFCIDEWQVFPREGRLARAQPTTPDDPPETVRLRPKAMDVLCVLAARAGQVVERDTLLSEAWGRTAVTDEPLTATIGELRRVLRDARGTPRYIETIPKRGYRLVCAVTALPTPAEPSLLHAASGADPATPDAADAPSTGHDGAVPATERITGRRRRPGVLRMPALRFVAVAILALALPSLAWLWLMRSGTAPPVGSIAVLPFVVQGGAPGDAYFGEGLAQEVLTMLAALDGLQVAARNSAFLFNERRGDLGALRNELGVATVLDGNLRRVGDRVRLQVQLVDTRTGFNLWAETYDRQLDDVFEVQTEIAQAIATRLNLRLRTPDDLRERGQSTDFVAQDLHLQAQHKLQHQRTEEGLRAARSLYEAALARDPQYAIARVGLAESWLMLGDLAFEPVQDAYQTARGHAQAALDIAPDLAVALRVLGWIHMYFDWDWARAEQVLQRALVLQPGSVGVLTAAAALNYHLDRLPVAVDLARRAADRDPLRPGTLYNLAYFSYAAGRLDESETALHRTLDLMPDFQGAHLLLAQIHLAQGDIESARIAAAREPHPILAQMARALVAVAADGDSTAPLAVLETDYADSAAYQIAVLHTVRGDHDAAFRWLDHALETRDPGLAELLVDPLLDPLHRDSRWLTLVDSVGLRPLAAAGPNPD